MEIPSFHFKEVPIYTSFQTLKKITKIAITQILHTYFNKPQPQHTIHSKGIK